MVAQIGEIERPFAIVLRVGFEDHAFDLEDKPVGDALGRAELLNKLLRQISRSRERRLRTAMQDDDQRRMPRQILRNIAVGPKRAGIGPEFAEIRQTRNLCRTRA